MSESQVGPPATTPQAPVVHWAPPPPPKPTFLQRYWPSPGHAAPASALGAILVSAVAAAISIPLDRPGVGWLCAGLVAMLTVGWVARRPVSAPSREFRIWRWIWGVLTLALLAVGAVRAAGWLYVLCVLTALVTGSLAFGGGSTAAGLIPGGLALYFAALRGLPWAARGFAAAGRVRGTSAIRLAATIAVSAVLLWVFGALFASADAAFANLAGEVLPDLRVDTVARWIFVGLLVGLGTIGATYLALAPPELDGAPRERRRQVRRLEWSIPVVLLDLLFLAFVLVQLTVLFGGSRHVLTTANLTYAQYARSGFWQLLVVTALTLGVLAAAARWAPRDARVDRVLVRGLLGVLAGLTLVVVASALYRMRVYEDAYGFTRLRVFVTVVELWLGLVFVLILVAGITLRARWLPRVVAVSAVVALLGLAVANPDRFIADRNIDRFQTTGKLDLAYLRRLSPDAVPALQRLPKSERDCAVSRIAVTLRRDPDDWRGANLARIAARRQLAADPPVGTCP